MTLWFCDGKWEWKNGAAELTGRCWGGVNQLHTKGKAQGSAKHRCSKYSMEKKAHSGTTNPLWALRYENIWAQILSWANSTKIPEIMQVKMHVSYENDAIISVYSSIMR